MYVFVYTFICMYIYFSVGVYICVCAYICIYIYLCVHISISIYIYIYMLRAILNKSWRQHPTRRQLYGHLPPIMKTIQVRRARHAGHCWRSKDELVSDVLLWTPTYGQAKAGRPARTYIYSSYVRTRDVTQKTCRRR